MSCIAGYVPSYVFIFAYINKKLNFAGIYDKRKNIVMEWGFRGYIQIYIMFTF